MVSTRVSKVFVSNDSVLKATRISFPGDGIIQPARHGSLSTNRRFLFFWVGAVFTPFMLQLRCYLQMVTPHKISQNLLVLDADPVLDQVTLHCPIRGIRIAGVWWNIWPTYYHITQTGKVCHFVVPQYNMHGAYHFGSDAEASSTASSNCHTPVTPVDYYFYHGSVGFYSFYEEGSGTYCADDWTATLTVYKLGSYDINGQFLADDRGSIGYRQSYWFGTVGLIWIIFRALVIRRSFIVFKRYLTRCQANGVDLKLRDVIIYIQESARLTAHGARGYHRIGLLVLLLEGLMADLFMFITKEGVSALIQCISLGYNLSAILSTLFEIIEGCGCLRKHVRAVKCVLFSHETAMVGELLGVFVIQALLTFLNKSRLQDTQSVALAMSYYVWGLMGHGFFLCVVTLFLFSVRAIGSFACTWWRYRSFGPLWADCCIDDALGPRQKLAIVTGCCWIEGKLFFSKDSLVAYGLMRVESESDGDSLLVHEKIRWFTAPRNGLVSIGVICGTHVVSCAERPVPENAVVVPCGSILGGHIDPIDVSDDDDEARGHGEESDRRALLVIHYETSGVKQ